jgi:hypothetical protein
MVHIKHAGMEINDSARSAILVIWKLQKEGLM